MPLFEYRCTVCLKTATEIRCIAERDKAPTCCGVPMQREITPVHGVVKNPAVPKKTR
jgi:putative FmdB family regulatory protein